MTIWVDADACPRAMRDILFKAANRTRVELVLVANRGIQTPPNSTIRAICVDQGFDVADHTIAQSVTKGDLVITADIPLADLVIKQGATALNPRGQLYTAQNISERLVVRDMMDELRGAGQMGGGPPPLSKQNLQQFANQLDRWITQHLSRNSR